MPPLAPPRPSSLVGARSGAFARWATLAALCALGGGTAALAQPRRERVRRGSPAAAPVSAGAAAEAAPSEAPPTAASAAAAPAPASDEPASAEPATESKADESPIRRRKRGAEAPAKAGPASDPEAALISDERVPLRLRAPAMAGPIGLDQVWSADPGAQGTIRLRLGLSTFNASDWPVKGSDNQFTGTTFALGWTPIKYLELFANVRSTSNTNKGEQPSLLQTQGDVTLGAKGGGFFTDSLAGGLAAAVHFLGGPGEAGIAGDATSFELRALFTADLQRKRDIPFRFLFDVSYYFENGRAVFDGQADLPSIIQEWGLQVGAYDRLMLGFGFEAPIWQWINPYAEYRIGTPFLVRLDKRGSGSRAFDFASVPHNLMLGVRSLPVEGVSLDLGARIGLSDQPYTGVPATPPWTLVLGVSYTLDPRPKVIEREVAPETPAPVVAATGEITGLVRASDGGAPLAEAQIRFPGQVGRSTQLTERDGSFGGYAFAPGEITVEARAPKYLTKTARVQVVAGQTAKVELSLDPDPKAKEGKVELRVFDDTGAALTAQATFGPPADRTVEVPELGGLRIDLPPGTYPLRVEAEGFVPVDVSVTVVGGQTENLRQPMVLAKGGKRPRKVKAAPEPRTPRASRASTSDDGQPQSAVKRGKRIKTGTPITFAEGAATLTPSGRRAVDAVAALLKRDPKIKHVQVEAHTDGRGEPAAQKTLTDQQAAAVKARLVQKGIAPARVRTVGKGGTQPIAPNLSAAGREKNRRVVLRIVE